MNIIFYGSPGSGKGTQANLLAKYLQIKKISVGDILREEVKEMSDFGKELKSYMHQGLLVPDELVTKVILENISQEGFILDGYPRNLNQAKCLEEILQKNKIQVDYFIYLEVSEQIIVDRLSKRRVCKNCSTNYHLANHASKKDGVCDSCGGELIQRKDDNPEAIKKRWDIFAQESRKLIKFYQDKSNLIKIDGQGKMDEIFDRIESQVQA